MTTEPRPQSPRPTSGAAPDDGLRALDDARRLLEVAGVATAVVDREGVVHAASPTFADVFGAEPDQVAGVHLMDLADVADRAAVLSGLARLADGTQHRAELALEHLSTGGPSVRGVLALGTVGTSHDPALPLLAVLTLDELQEIRQTLQAAGRPLEIYSTYYTTLLKLPLDDYLKLLDGVTFWTWKPEDLDQLETSIRN